jgi:energy-converting hydrogenase A subunit R
MHKVQLITDCEGPLALNDSAFELCRDFITPMGDRLYQQVSRYNDYLAEVAKKPDPSGNTLKLILPFLKAYGLTNAQLADQASKTAALMPGAAGAYKFLHGREFPIFAISTGFRPFAEAVGLKLGFDRDHILATDLDLDRFDLAASEAGELKRLAEEIADAPAIEVTADAKSLADLPGPTQETIATLDRIFGERLPAMEIGAILEEVKPLGGPGKAQAVTDSLAKTGLARSDTIYVGASSTDVQALETVRTGAGLAISFNGDQPAVAAAEVVMVSDSAWSLALVTAIFQLWGKEGVLEVAAPETRNKSRSLVLPEEVIDPIMGGLDGHMVNIYLSASKDRAAMAKEGQAMTAKLRGAAVAGLG